MKDINKATVFFAAGATLLLPTVTFSQELEKIVVTAQKRETSLDETPIAISAMSAKNLEKQQVDGLADVQHNVPNMVMGELGDQAQITIRGVGTDVATSLADPSVASHVDGVYRGGLSSSTQLFFDMQRLEVLRGPQGTLYGRNTTGGSINVITKLPGDKSSFEADALVGSFERVKAKVAGDIAIADNFKVRAAVLHDTNSGERKNTFTGEDIDDSEVTIAKLAAVYYPTDDLTLTLRAGWYESEASGPPYVFGSENPVAPFFITSLNPGGLLNFPQEALGGASFADVFNLDLQEGGTISTDPQRLNLDQNTTFKRDSSDVNGTVEWDIDGVLIKSITSYYDMNKDSFANDLDGVEVPIMSQVIPESIREFSQEFNVSGVAFDDNLDWIVGTFYYNSDVSIRTRFEMPGLQATYEALFGIFATGQPFPSGTLSTFGTDTNGNTSAIPFLDFEEEQNTKSIAAFSQGTYALTEDLRATLGVRWTRDEKEVTQSILNNLEPGDACRDEHFERSWNQVTGKVGLDYRVTDDALIYSTVSNGFKSGGMNFGACGNDYDPETLWAYEVGAKTTWLDNSLQLNATAFYYDYSDFQSLNFIDNASIVENAADAEITGVEFEWVARVTEAFLFDGHLSWLDSEFNEFISSDPMNPQVGFDCNEFGLGCSQDLSGNPLTKAPKYSGAINATYTLDLAEHGSVDFRIEYTFTDDVSYSVFDSDNSTQEGYSLTNLRVIWESGEQWSVQAFVENLNNKDYTVGITPYSTLGGTLYSYAPPRTFGLQASYRWKEM